MVHGWPHPTRMFYLEWIDQMAEAAGGSTQPGLTGDLLNDLEALGAQRVGG